MNKNLIDTLEMNGFDPYLAENGIIGKENSSRFDNYRYMMQEINVIDYCMN